MQRQKPSEDLKWSNPNFSLIVIAENIHSPANVGLLIRACECFGVKKLYFSGPYRNTSTNKFRKTARAAEKYLSISEADDTLELISSLKADAYKVIAIEITEESKSLSSYKIKKGENIALLLGSERHGVAEKTLENVDDAAHITQYGTTGSLNVAMALNLALYEFTNQLL